MAKPKAFVVYGLGIGCQQEVAHAYERAGAEAEIVHIRQLLSGEKKIFDSQITNWSGGFLHGDMGGAGMYAANEFEHASILSGDEEKRFKDMLIEYSEKGNIVYGQCNGFQLLVKTGLLPGIDGDYSRQRVTLTGNSCGSYRVAPVLHKVETDHFAFRGAGDYVSLWCRHGEGRLLFWSEHGIITREEGEATRAAVNKKHVLLRYAHAETKEPTEEFPHSPNQSVDGIAGLVNENGNIFAHMAHTEVSIYASRNPLWFNTKDRLRRKGIRAEDLEGKLMEDIGLAVFRNIVERFK